MSTTRSNNLNQILTNILDATDDLIRTMKHESVPNVAALLGMDISDYSDMEWENEDGDIKPITKHSKGLLCTFKCFAIWKMQEEGINISIDPKNIDKTEFQNFQVGPNNTDEAMKSGTSSFAPPSRAPKAPDALCEFNKGIQRDQDRFPELTRNSNWHNFQRIFKIQANAQGVERVLDAAFTPSSTEDDAVFQAQQKFMMAVLTDKLKTDKGKEIVRTHADSFDAQAAWQELVAHHTSSTQAEADAESILHYLISSCINDGSWKGTTHAYILHWLHQADQYDEKADDSLPATHKLAYLQHAVAPNPELAAIKTTSLTAAKLTGKKLDFNDYVDLLKNAALQYDVTVNKTSPQDKRRPRRQVYSHDISWDDEPPDAFHDDFQDAQEYDIDTPLFEINYQKSFQHPRLSRDTWYSLTPADQAAWDTLSDSAKSAILKGKPMPSSHPTTPRRVPPHKSVSRPAPAPKPPPTPFNA